MSSERTTQTTERVREASIAPSESAREDVEDDVGVEDNTPDAFLLSKEARDIPPDLIRAEYYSFVKRMHESYDIDITRGLPDDSGRGSSKADTEDHIPISDTMELIIKLVLLRASQSNSSPNEPQTQKFLQDIEILTRAITPEPGDSVMHYVKSEAFLALNKIDEAIEEYNKIIEDDPTNFKNYNHKGLTLYNLGRYEAALAAFDRSIKIGIELNPEFAIVYSTQPQPAEAGCG